MFKKPVFEAETINIREMVVAAGLRRPRDDQMAVKFRRAVKLAVARLT
jgi:hypothetical protein